VVASASVMSSSLPVTVTTSGGAEVLAQVLVEGLVEPTDLAFAPDGALLIAERAGRVLVFRAGQLQAAPALTLPDVAGSASQGLLAVAVDPQFGKNRFVYLVYTTEAGFRLARFRAVGDTLGDRAILLEGVPSSANHAAAFLRFGPDGRLYLGLDDAGDWRRAGDLGSYNGKVLRLNADATTPADQAGASPVYAPSVSAPHGADWDGTGATLWVVDRPEGGGQLQVIAAGADGDGRGRRGTPVARFNLPDRAMGSGLAFYRGELLPAWRGNLLVTLDGPVGEAALLRLMFDRDESRTVARTERLLKGSLDGARGIAVSQEGRIYVTTRTALVTLGPAESP